MGYEPSPDFELIAKDPLVELNLTDPSELWLIQWPLNQTPDFDGKEVTLKLHHDGHLGSLEGSSAGKSYDVVSFASQHPDATVLLSSTSKTKIVGKIARHVSFVHYPEPEELQQQNPNNYEQMYEKSATLTNSCNRLTTSTQRTRSRHLQSGSGLATSSRSSQRKSSLLISDTPSKAPKRKYVDEPTKSERHVALSSGSLGHSEKRNRRRKILTEKESNLLI